METFNFFLDAAPAFSRDLEDDFIRDELTSELNAMMAEMAASSIDDKMIAMLKEKGSMPRIPDLKVFEELGND